MSRAWWPSVAALALAGAGLVLIATVRFGAGIWADSLPYVDVARNIAAGRGLVFHTGEPLVWWPPLYPALLALVGIATRLDPTAVAHFVNAALFAVVILLSARLLRSGSSQPLGYSILGLCAVVFAIPLASVYAMAWSETLFIPLVLLHLVAAQRYWRTGGLLALTGMTAWTALACLTRYVGIALVPAGVATILLASGVGIGRRFARACGFAAASLAPLGLWALRNHRLTGTFFGGRYSNEFTLVDNVVHYARAVFRSLVPDFVGRAMTSGFGLLTLVGLVAFGALVIASRTARARLVKSLKAAVSDLPPAALFVLSFPVVLLLAARTAGADVSINMRMVSPAFVPGVLLFVKLLYRFFVPRGTGTGRFGRAAPVVLLVLLFCLPLVQVASSTARRFTQGAGGCSTRQWRESETIAWAREALTPVEGPEVFSNGPDVLWELARVNARPVPSRRQANLADLEGRWPGQSEALLVQLEHVAWLDHLFGVDELAEVSDVVEVERFSDGVVYRVSARTRSALSTAVPAAPTTGVDDPPADH